MSRKRRWKCVFPAPCERSIGPRAAICLPDPSPPLARPGHGHHRFYQLLTRRRRPQHRRRGGPLSLSVPAGSSTRAAPSLGPAGGRDPFARGLVPSWVGGLLLQRARSTLVGIDWSTSWRLVWVYGLHSRKFGGFGSAEPPWPRRGLLLGRRRWAGDGRRSRSISSSGLSRMLDYGWKK